MAEIKIQEKKRPVWPWILGILLIAAAIIWFVLADRYNDADMDDNHRMNDTTSFGMYYNPAQSNVNEIIVMNERRILCEETKIG